MLKIVSTQIVAKSYTFQRNYAKASCIDATIPIDKSHKFAKTNLPRFKTPYKVRHFALTRCGQFRREPRRA
jgi:hypothetical protein